MGLDERLFGALARRWRAWRRRRTAADRAGAIPTTPMLGRLRVVASAVAGREIELGLHGGGLTMGGDRIWLPHTLDVLATAADNERLARVSTAFAAAVLRARPQPPRGADADARWVTMARAIEAALAEELPGWAQQRDLLTDAVLAGRPPIEALDGGAALLEAVVQHALGRPLDALREAVSVEIADLLPRAVDAAVDLAALLRGVDRPGRNQLVAVPLWGSLVAVDRGDLGAVLAPATDVETGDVTERESPARRAVRRRVLDPQGTEDNPLTHSFEKVHTAEEHAGADKHADGSDELDDHHDALGELDLDEVVISGERTSSVYRADLSLFGGVAADSAGEGGVHYDEWDPARRRYLARYCSLRVEEPVADHDAGAALGLRVRGEQRRALQALQDALHRVKSALRWSSRQSDGPEIDIAAVVERGAALRAGHDGPARLYLRRRRRGHDVAMLVLVDASLSTDAWVDDRRVLDTARDAATCLLLAFEPHVTELGLAAFRSFTREDCRFVALKGFAESTRVGLGRLAPLRPAGYTRIGPALRHAYAVMLGARARRRAVVLITDGKPTDTDHYEGRHGFGDVRQALREGDRLGVDTFALAIDPRAAAQLPAMFGARGFAGMASVDALTNVASRLFERLRAR